MADDPDAVHSPCGAHSHLCSMLIHCEEERHCKDVHTRHRRRDQPDGMAILASLTKIMLLTRFATFFVFCFFVLFFCGKNDLGSSKLVELQVSICQGVACGSSSLRAGWFSQTCSRVFWAKRPSLMNVFRIFTLKKTGFGDKF